MITTHQVSRDNSKYEAFPDVALTESGRLVCVFLESTHHSDRSYTNIVVTHSDDRGESWSTSKSLTEPHLRTDDKAFWDCPRISRLSDGRLVAVVNEISGTLQSRESERNYLYFSSDDGKTWDGPHETPVKGIVPDQIVELKHGENSGRLLLATHTAHQQNGEQTFEVKVWKSDTGGKSWNGPSVIAAVPELNLCEPSIVEVPTGELVCFMRENSGQGLDAFKTISEDDGESWNGLYKMPIPACHRPVAGMLSEDRVLVTFRFMQGGKGWLGPWTQNTFATLTDVDSCLSQARNQAWTRIRPLAFDRSPVADTGYTGWVQFDDGEIYVVNYIVDDAPPTPVSLPGNYEGEYDTVPKAYIEGYSLTIEDIIDEPDQLGPDI